MPEIGEVAHAASILHKFAKGKVIKSIETTVDDKVFVGPALTNDIFEKEFTNLTVTDVGRHGKYFWMRIGDDGKVLLLHFGMTGWIKVKDIETHFIVMENGGDQKVKDIFKDETAKKDLAKMEVKHVKDEQWPPRFYKFVLKFDDDTEIAYLDGRRLGRLRLLNAKDDDKLMQLEPLSKLGLDFSKEEGRWDLDTFKDKLSKRRVAIKTVLMDQTMFSGIGNWVADEVCYQARLHPEVLASELDADQLKLVYEKVIDICSYAVQVEGNTALFPSDWLMLYRWGKRRKNDVDKTPDGYVIKHLTVGGRTAAYVPELQVKKGGSGSSSNSTSKAKTPAKQKKRARVKTEDSDSEEETTTPTTTTRSGRVSKRSK